MAREVWRTERHLVYFPGHDRPIDLNRRTMEIEKANGLIERTITRLQEERDSEVGQLSRSMQRDMIQLGYEIAERALRLMQEELIK